MTLRLVCSWSILVIAQSGWGADAAAPSVTPPAASAPRPKPEFQYQSAGIEIPAATAEEPFVAAFGPESIDAARRYLDDGATAWVRERKCVACHSTGVYLVERPSLTAWLGPPSDEVRNQFIASLPDRIGNPQERHGKQFYGAAIQAVWRSGGLAAWDRHVTGTLAPETDRALRQTLACLADDGSIMTFNQVEIPYITTDFELTVQAARAIATAPGWLATVTDDDTRERIARLQSYLAQHQPISDYEHALKLQLATYMPDLVSPEQRETSQEILWRQQQPDGGWSTRRMADVHDWHIEMDPKVVAMIEEEPDAASPGSDAYMTAFAIVLLRETGTPADDPKVQRGIAWLKTSQRVSGRWWMKSLFRDTYHFSTYISTAQVLRALALCGELPTLQP